MALETLRVLPVGNLLVLDIEYAAQTGKRRYIGRDEVRAWKAEELPAGVPCHMQYNEFLEPGHKPIPHSAYPAHGRAEEVKSTGYYRKAVAKGDLAPADAATAAECGVQFTD